MQFTASTPSAPASSLALASVSLMTIAFASK